MTPAAAGDGPRKRRRKGTSRACTHCNRTFKRIEHLDRHVRTHTKEKPFVCSCEATFARRDLLTRHWRQSGHDEAARPPSKSLATSSDQVNPIDTTAAIDACGEQFEPAVLAPGDHTFSLQAISSQAQSCVNSSCGPIPNTSSDNAMFEQGIDGYETFDHFGQFAFAMDGLGLPDDWSPFDHIFDDTHATHASRKDWQAVDGDTQLAQDHERSGTPFSSWLPSAPTGDQVSMLSNQPIKQRESIHGANSWKLSSSDRDKIKGEVDTFAELTNLDFDLPSRHTLSRYLAVFFCGFNRNLPFIHHTWQPTQGPVEVLLSICAIGAQNCCEHAMSRKFFLAGRVVQLARLRQHADKLGPTTVALLGAGGNGFSYPTRDSRLDDTDSPAFSATSWCPLDAVRSSLLLLCYAAWSDDLTIVKDTFMLWSLLSHLLTDVGLNEPQVEQPITDREEAWRVAMYVEAGRRTKLSAMSFLATTSIAYDFSVGVRSPQNELTLPCPQAEWEAENAAQWESARHRSSAPQMSFQDAVQRLLAYESGSTSPLEPLPTSLGNYLLIHDLLQRTLAVRELNDVLGMQTAPLPLADIEKLERALRAWTVVWQLTPESSVDPGSDPGRIPSTSSALLSLAYTRLHLDVGPHRRLESRDPNQIAAAIKVCPPVKRSKAIISALLYATHALSIPVRLGLDRVARAEVSLWTVRHSLAGFESAIMLSKWLSAVSISKTSPLTDAEGKIMYWVKCIVQEAASVLCDRNLTVGSPVELNWSILSIWAYFFRRHTVHAIINILGDSLAMYRDLLLGEMRL